MEKLIRGKDQGPRAGSEASGVDGNKEGSLVHTYPRGTNTCYALRLYISISLYLYVLIHRSQHP